MTSCMYNTNEIYFRDVNKNIPTPSINVFSNINSDTVFIFGTPNIHMNIHMDNNKLYAANFYVNGNKLENVQNDNQGNFSFWFNISNGVTYKLTTEFYISTETGSIADKTGAEAFVLKSKEWVLIYSADKPICTSEIVDGRLKLSWTPYKNIGSNKYYVTYGSIRDSTYNHWYIDSTYFGNYRSYVITVNDKGLSGYRAEFTENYVNNNIFYQHSDSIIIKWNKWPFYNNISGYRIETGDDYFPPVYNKPDDTTYVFTGGTRDQYYNFDIYVLPKTIKTNQPYEYHIGGITRTY